MVLHRPIETAALIRIQLLEIGPPASRARIGNKGVLPFASTLKYGRKRHSSFALNDRSGPSSIYRVPGNVSRKHVVFKESIRRQHEPIHAVRAYVAVNRHS